MVELGCKEAERLLSKMRELIQKTRMERREYGLIVCNSRLQESVGKATSIDVGSCNINERATVHFHTHPLGTSWPSKADLEEWGRIRPKIACIGTKEEIVCFTEHDGWKIQKCSFKV